MGFGVNFNKPIIQETQAMHDGGAGNLGYFEQGEQEKKEKSIFTEAKEKDTFEKSGLDEDISEEFSLTAWIENLLTAIKEWFKKNFNLS